MNTDMETKCKLCDGKPEELETECASCGFRQEQIMAQEAEKALVLQEGK